MRAVSSGHGGASSPLLPLLPPLPACGCRPCPLGHSLGSTSAARAMAGTGGKTGLLQGWKQVLLAPQSTINFRRSSQDHTFDSSHRAGTAEFCTFAAEGEQKATPAQKPSPARHTDRDTPAPPDWEPALCPGLPSPSSPEAFGAVQHRINRKWALNP